MSDPPESIGAAPAHLTWTVLPGTVSSRGYFSSYFLHSAIQSAEGARRIEDAPDTAPFDWDHRSLVLASVISAACFVEAMVNEIVQDVVDEHGETHAVLGSDEGQATMLRDWWTLGQGVRSSPLAKYQMLLSLAGKPKLDEGRRPYTDVVALHALRNAIVHYKPEDLTEADEPRLKRRLEGKFPANSLMVGMRNPWWPDHALGAGCAEWAWHSAKDLADTVVEALGIVPSYQRLGIGS